MPLSQPKQRNPVMLFVLDTTERATKTAAQVALLTFGTDSLNVWSLPWHTALGVTLGAAMLSVLTSLASVGAGSKDSASLIR